jgi:hypothetical protein
MSRTQKDKPWRVRKKTRPWSGGYPPPFGGAYSGIGEMTTLYWRAERAKIKTLLRRGIEPPPTLPRNSERWNRW